MKTLTHKQAPLFFVAVLALAGMPASEAKDSKGYPFIIGGGRQPAAMTKRFVERAGGESKAKIIVIPMANGSPAESGEHQVSELKSHVLSGMSRLRRKNFH